MALSSQETAWLGNFQRRFNDLAEVITLLKGDKHTYTKRVYSALTDPDLGTVELTAAQLSSGINFVTEIENLLAGLATNTQDWQATLEQVRRI